MSKSIKDYMIIWTDDGRVGLQRWPSNGQRLSELEEYEDGCADDMPGIAKIRNSKW